MRHLLAVLTLGAALALAASAASAADTFDYAYRNRQVQPATPHPAAIVVPATPAAAVAGPSAPLSLSQMRGQNMGH